MILHRATWVALFAACVFIWMSGTASGITVTGTIEPVIPSGKHMALTMTIDDAKTTFELTGPDYSWFAFGFDTTTMQGYSLIVEGTDANRTAVEQNLLGIGSPGDPQAVQNLNILSTTHDSANDLTTIVIERPNNTGDVNDPVFSPSMESLEVIWGYSAFSSPTAPAPILSYHGSGGRGFDTITFSVVPEPTSTLLAVLATVIGLSIARRRSSMTTELEETEVEPGYSLHCKRSKSGTVRIFVARTSVRLCPFADGLKSVLLGCGSTGPSSLRLCVITYSSLLTAVLAGAKMAPGYFRPTINRETFP